MRDYKLETEKRVAFIKEKMAEAHANGLIFGNSGGKDSALVGILCKMATDNVLAVAMPCHSKRNYGEDMDDAIALAKSEEAVSAEISGKNIIKELYVPKKLVNIVVK